MKPHIRKHFVTCALLAGAAFAVQAQPATGTPPAGGPQAQQGHHGFDPAKRAERMNQHLADLKQKLKLAPNQEGAWTSFTSAMQPPAAGQRPAPGAMANLSTPDRIDQMRAMRDRHNAEMDRRAEATKAFYAQLNADQKKTFDAETARMFHRGPGEHHQRG